MRTEADHEARINAVEDIRTSLLRREIRVKRPAFRTIRVEIRSVSGELGAVGQFFTESGWRYRMQGLRVQRAQVITLHEILDQAFPVAPHTSSALNRKCCSAG